MEEEDRGGGGGGGRESEHRSFRIHRLVLFDQECRESIL